MKMWVGTAGKAVRSLENVLCLSASEVMIHEEALYQVHIHLPLLYLQLKQTMVAPVDYLH